MFLLLNLHLNGFVLTYRVNLKKENMFHCKGVGSFFLVQVDIKDQSKITSGVCSIVAEGNTETDRDEVK